MVHLVDRVHVMQDAAVDPIAAYRAVNTEGTMRLADAAASSGVRQFVFLSTVKVCGEGRNEPYRETDAAEPQDPYALSKWEAEQAIRQVTGSSQMTAAVLRPPLVYGPGTKANFLKLMQLVDCGLPLPLGAVTNARSLIYVDNLVDAIVACASSDAAAGQSFFVADTETPSTPDLVRAIASALDRPARLFPVPATWLGVLARMAGKKAMMDRLTGSLQVDTSHIRNTLGWRPPFSLHEGLAHTAAWYRGNHRRRISEDRCTGPIF